MGVESASATGVLTFAADVPYTPLQHLRLALFGVVSRIVEACTAGDVEAALELHPFLGEYVDEMHAALPAGDSMAERWWPLVCEWEREAVRGRVHLPLVALRNAGLSALELELLLAVGLIEEDPRFAAIFEQAQRTERRPTFGLLMAWWRDDGHGGDRATEIRDGLQRLIDHGLIQLRNGDAPRADWILAPVLAVWDGLRGRPPATAWLTHVPIESLPDLDTFVASEATHVACRALPALLGARPAPLLLVRGPVHNGRKTLASVLARSMNRPLLVARDAVFDDPPRWRALGALVTRIEALPVVEGELAPGETRTLPPLPLASGPIVVVTGRHGAWQCADGRPILTIDLPLPAEAERLSHWRAVLPAAAVALLPDSARGTRLSSGHIRSVATGAASLARLAGRTAIETADVRRACATLQSARLETLATRLEVRGALSDLAVDADTREELDALVARCRWREALAAASPSIAGVGVGVRALLAGPSGTGKTLAAKLLAAQIGKELYRIDLAATVNKYLGETEKSLNRALTAAEELDVVLLLDEGDALMATRTDVGSSNDRYANLETNFLLQRLDDSFEGVLLVTTNAADRLDRAFSRRMDVVIKFRAPDAARRLEILTRHLADDALDEAWLEDAACRCALGGGQWRNVVAHARLLALDAGRPLGENHLHAALEREYRKSGASCPLRPPQAQPWPR